jgi:DNA repair protein RadC
MNELNTQERATYDVGADKARDDRTIADALAILGKRMQVVGDVIKDPTVLRQLKLGGLDHEAFGVLFLDCGNRVIAYEEMFRGTIDKVGVHVREIVISVLKHKAARIVIVHNHPSGSTKPSGPDKEITVKVAEAMANIDVDMLDHVIVGPDSYHSMGELEEAEMKASVPHAIRDLIGMLEGRGKVIRGGDDEDDSGTRRKVRH